MRDLPLDHTNPDFALAASGLRLLRLLTSCADRSHYPEDWIEVGTNTFYAREPKE